MGSIFRFQYPHLGADRTSTPQIWLIVSSWSFQGVTISVYVYYLEVLVVSIDAPPT
jgi:hypothetical protein